jgi:hypothetical protein
MLSALQVKQHHISSLAFSPAVDLTEQESSKRSLTCAHQLELSHRNDSDRFWLARLRVEFLHPENGPRSLYVGHCEMIAELELVAEVPEPDRIKLVSLNAGAILYSSIREWFATLSARSLHGLIELPTIDARCFIPREAEQRTKVKSSK